MQPKAKEQLDMAIERLFSTFAAYPLRDHIFACDHCVFPEDHARLHSKPLRDLQERDLSRYAHKAMTTWGDENDFRHFLPRLLQLVAEGTSWPISVDRLIEYKLNDAQWYQWPEEEQSSIRNYVLALWTYQLTLEDNSHILQELLTAALRAGPGTSSYLKVWASFLPEHLSPVRNLCEFIYTVVLISDQSWRNNDNAEQPTEDSPVWDEPVVTWLLSTLVKESLLKAKHLPQFASELPSLDQAIAHLEWLHSIPIKCVSIGY